MEEVYSGFRARVIFRVNMSRIAVGHCCPVSLMYLPLCKGLRRTRSFANAPGAPAELFAFHPVKESFDIRGI